MSLRQQLQDVGKKLVGAQHYNKDGSVSIRQVTLFFLFNFVKEDMLSVNISCLCLSFLKRHRLRVLWLFDFFEQFRGIYCLIHYF